MESSSGKILSVGLLWNGSTMALVVANGTISAGLTAVPTSISAPSYYASAQTIPSVQGYWQLVISGTNILFNISSDGLVWHNLGTYPFTTYFTTAPNLIGVCTPGGRNNGLRPECGLVPTHRLDRGIIR